MTNPDQANPNPLTMLVGVVMAVIKMPWWLFCALVWANRRYPAVLLVTWLLFTASGVALGRWFLPAACPGFTAEAQVKGKPCGDGWIARDKTCHKEDH